MGNVGDEKVDPGQIIQILQSLGLNPLTADIQKVLKDSELDKTRIDFPTFVSIFEQFQKRPTIANHADLMEMFKCFDREFRRTSSSSSDHSRTQTDTSPTKTSSSSS